MKKINRRKIDRDIEADIMGGLMALCLVGAVFLSCAYIYTWWRPHGPIARAVGIQSPVSSSEVAP